MSNVVCNPDACDCAEVSLPPGLAAAFDDTGWVLTDLEMDAVTGTLKLATGEASGSAVSPVYEMPNYNGGYGQFRYGGTVPLGCVLRFRFRSAATAEGVAAATWLPWCDVLHADGVSRNDLDTLYANAGLTPGAFFQVEWYLRKQ